MFKITKLGKDADALLALALALLGLLALLFLPDAAVHRLHDRAAALYVLIASPAGLVVLRYALRIVGAVQQGKVMQVVAADPHAPDVTPAVAPGLYVNPPAGNPVGASVETLPADALLAGDELHDYSQGE